LAACAGLPDRIDSLEQARQSIDTVEQDPLAGQVAARELTAARDALASADEAYEERESLETIEHRAYVAQRYADISQELVAEATAREEVERGEAERNRIIADAREREAEAATRQAREATRELDAQALAADAAQERASDLERELEELEARNTDRGLVLTLGDVLFDTGEATLKAGAATTIDRLAQFMRDYPEHAVRIEGHTDSTGSDETNRSLSERRAQSVRDALLARGLAAERIATLGYGEAQPIASNDTAAGRQLIRSSWYICAIPGVAIMITVLCLNLIGDGLNDALNPKLRYR
jgi:outer membrane protein OmpA-like peptidoglycan-associated protein